VTKDLCPFMMEAMASVSEISGWGWYPSLTVSCRCLGRKSSKSRPAGRSLDSGTKSIFSSDVGGDGVADSTGVDWLFVIGFFFYSGKMMAAAFVVQLLALFEFDVRLHVEAAFW